jgi:hypothetical protein
MSEITDSERNNAALRILNNPNLRASEKIEATATALQAFDRESLDDLMKVYDPAPTGPTRQRMHITTVEFSIVLDDLSIEEEVQHLTSSIQEAYDQFDMPDGSFRIVAVSSEIEHRELDPCFTGDGFVAGWSYGTGHPSSIAVGMTPMQALQNIRENAWQHGSGQNGFLGLTREDFEQFVRPFTHTPTDLDIANRDHPVQRVATSEHHMMLDPDHGAGYR